MQDIQVLGEVVDRVVINSADITRMERPRFQGFPYEDEEDEYNSDEDDMDRFKKKAKRETTKVCKILCTWDCAWIWIRISEVLSFLVFDAFTEVFITLCIVVNIIFMALNRYELECDDNDNENKKLDGM